LIEVLVVIAIIGILAAVLVSGVFNARRRTVDAAAHSYTRQVVTWIAAADTGGNDLENLNDCTDEPLRNEGAYSEYPNGVATCSITYEDGHWTVTTVSTSGNTYTTYY